MIKDTEVASRIGAYLKLNGRKAVWLGEQMGWSHEKTSATLNGKRRLTIGDFFKACRVLDVPYEQFITPEDYED